MAAIFDKVIEENENINAKYVENVEESLSNLDIKLEKVEMTKITYPILLNKEYAKEINCLTPYGIAYAYFEGDELIHSPKKGIEKDMEIIKLKQRVKELESEIEGTNNENQN